MIIHHDQLPVAAKLENLFRLADKRFEASAEALLLISGRNNHRSSISCSGSGWSYTVPWRPESPKARWLIRKSQDRFPVRTPGSPLSPAYRSPLPPALSRLYLSLSIIGMCVSLVLSPSAACLRWPSSAGCDRGAHPDQTGKIAPDFTVSDGTTSIHLANYRGRVVLLNFWASWCAPCIQETPALLQLQHDRPDLAILAVSIDEDPGAYSRFLARYHVDLTSVRDPDQSAAKLYDTDGWPETYIIDKKASIRRKIVGDPDWSNPEFVPTSTASRQENLSHRLAIIAYDHGGYSLSLRRAAH